MGTKAFENNLSICAEKCFKIDNTSVFSIIFTKVELT